MDDLDRCATSSTGASSSWAARRPCDELGATEAALRRLHDAHMIVLEPGPHRDPDGQPVLAVPTPYRVEAGGRSWFANCAWDALGIPAALDGRPRRRRRARTAASRSSSRSRGGGPGRRSSTARSRRRWWDDIVFT